MDTNTCSHGRERASCCEYRRIMAVEDYDKARARAWNECHKTILWAQELFDTVKAQAWETYDKALAQARDIYEKSITNSKNNK